MYVGTWHNAALVSNLLQTEGIATLVAADVQAPRFRRAVYVLDADQVDEARDIVTKFKRGEPLGNPRLYRSWRCRECNELIEGQFAVCWNCGSAKTP